MCNNNGSFGRGVRACVQIESHKLRSTTDDDLYKESVSTTRSVKSAHRRSFKGNWHMDEVKAHTISIIAFD